jgi:hypothetical protein
MIATPGGGGQYSLEWPNTFRKGSSDGSLRFLSALVDQAKHPANHRSRSKSHRGKNRALLIPGNSSRSRTICCVWLIDDSCCDGLSSELPKSKKMISVVLTDVASGRGRA